MRNTINVNGKRYVCKIYDNDGETIDRYTVVFKAFRSHGRLYWPALASSESPFSPQGFGQHVELSNQPADYLGKRIAFEDCPADVQTFILLQF